MLSDREDTSYGGKQEMLYVAALFKNTESSVIVLGLKCIILDTISQSDLVPLYWKII